MLSIPHTNNVLPSKPKSTKNKGNKYFFNKGRLKKKLKNAELEKKKRKLIGDPRNWFGLIFKCKFTVWS